MAKPLVSVIVPTFNSAPYIERCLRSIREQSYRRIEIIVVDNNSTDATKQLAKRYADKVFNRGPERSAQVNFGVQQARGSYVYKVDSDFVLDPTVVAECVVKAQEGCDAVVVHNSPDTSVSWIARIRKFEVDMYKYDLTHSSARFVRKDVYQAVGGFDESVTAGEDYDFQNKLNRSGYVTGFVDAEALHLGEPKKLIPHLKKYYAYGKDFHNYKRTNQAESGKQLAFVRTVYLKNFRRFIRHPLLGGGFVVYATSKYAAGALGYLSVLMRKPSTSD